MARPIEEYEVDTEMSAESRRRDGSTSRSTARAFAAAISALAISALVITTSADALDPLGTVAETSVDAGTIALTDDDDDGALFTLPPLGPNRRETSCIEVRYEGTILPVDLTLSPTVQGELAPYLLLTVESGTGGGYEDCDDFVPESVVFDGTLAEMGAAEPRYLGQYLNNGDARSFRFSLEMADEQAAVGKTATVTFAWEVTPA